MAAREENDSMIIVSDINCISSGILLIIITGITQIRAFFFFFFSYCNHEEIRISGLLKLEIVYLFTFFFLNCDLKLFVHNRRIFTNLFLPII